MTQEKIALSILAHPDDAEFLCAGTLALLHKNGWEIHVATMTPGDCGSTEYSRQQISSIRKVEAEKSANILDGTYHCLELDDVFIMYDRPSLLKMIALLRKVKPTIIFANSPEDYFVDHEHSSKLVRTACFACGIPNVETDGASPFNMVPYLYYADPTEGNDKYGDEIEPSILVDISSEMEVKEEMLCCHKSQRDWLMAHNGMDEYIQSMKEFAAKRGKKIKCNYAEGFRQHLGHGYPQDNILKKELSNLVTKFREL